MYRWFRSSRDPISSYTHFLGACLSFLVTVIFFVLGLSTSSTWLTIGSSLIFGISLLALYSASSIYHHIPAASTHLSLFRKLDHTMIYVLIAGSYTPIVLTFMERTRGIRFISIIWLIALVGIFMKIVWLKAPRLLYTLLYVAMGWAIVFDIGALSEMPNACLLFIALGGLSYTIGAVIYILKKPNFTKSFGFHELFHIFIMIGSAFHIWAVIQFIILR